MSEHLKNTRIASTATYAGVARSIIRSKLNKDQWRIVPLTTLAQQDRDEIFYEVNRVLGQDAWYEAVSRFDAIDEMLNLLPHSAHLTNYSIGVYRLSQYLHEVGMDLSMISKKLPRVSKEYATSSNERRKMDAYISKTLITTFTGEDVPKPTIAVLMDALVNSAGPKTVLTANYLIKTIVGQDSPEYREFVTIAWNRLLGYKVNPNQLFSILTVKNDKLVKPKNYTPKPDGIQDKSTEVHLPMRAAPDAKDVQSFIADKHIGDYSSVAEEVQPFKMLELVNERPIGLTNRDYGSNTTVAIEAGTFPGFSVDNTGKFTFANAMVDDFSANLTILIGTGYVDLLNEQTVNGLKELLIDQVMKRVQTYNDDEACEVYERKLRRMLDAPNQEQENDRQEVLHFDADSMRGSWSHSKE